MTDTVFVNNVTLTDSDWFNDVNRLHYTILVDPANLAAAQSTLGINTALAKSINDFRLTLSTGFPVALNSISSAATIYATPYTGNNIALYDGTIWNNLTSAEFSSALGTLTNTMPYDVFCYASSGTVPPALEFQTWSTVSTRLTSLSYQNGVLSKTGTLTRRYIGTFVTVSTTATADSTTQRYVYNYNNRVLKSGLGTFSTDRGTATSVYVELGTDIRNNFVLGVSEDPVFISATGGMIGLNSSVGAYVGIGIDSATVETQLQKSVTIGAGGLGGIAIAGYKIGLDVGTHYATLLGRNSDNATSTWAHSADTLSTTKTHLHTGIMG